MFNAEFLHTHNTIFHNDEIYSVSHFLQLCNKTLTEQVPLLWISGEVSNLVVAKSGHSYFSLKDDNASVRCVLFRLSAKRLKFNLENGIQIMVYAATSIYEARGDLQLVVNTIEPIGIGSIELALKQLKEKLYKEGLFDARYKKLIPRFPQKIGIITSAKSAVIADIIKVTSLRYPYAELKVYDVNTQGEQAVGQIIAALRVADTAQLDTIIIARGGGSTEDLYVFNDEVLARAVFAAQTPIISSIGHEINNSIIDFVADAYASTPSAAAMLATPDNKDIIAKKDLLIARLTQLMQLRIQIAHKELKTLQERLLTPQLRKERTLLEQYHHRLHYITKNTLANKKVILQRLTALLQQHTPQASIEHKQQQRVQQHKNLVQYMENRVAQYQQKLSVLEIELIRVVEKIVAAHTQQLEKNIQALEHLSPLKVLARGYSITLKDNQVLIDASKVKAGDILTTTLHSGSITSRVIK